MLNDKDATQENIDTAVELLRQAIDNLVERASQELLETLQTKLEECKNLEENYTLEEFSQLKEIIEKAELLLQNESDNISNETVDQVLNELIEASDALYVVTATNELKSAITNANEILNSDLSEYLEESVTALRNALNDAQALIDDQCQDLNLINEAVKNINTAISQMQKIVDKTALTALISNAEIYQEGSYTTDSWAVLQEALTAAKDTIIGFVNKVDGLDQSKYSAQSWQQFETALNSAKEIIADENALQDETDNAYETLVKAYLGLRYKLDRNMLEGLK